MSDDSNAGGSLTPTGSEPAASADSSEEPGPHGVSPGVVSALGRKPRDNSLSIVIPAKNEARNLPHVLAGLPKDCQVVLVDGHSTDDTVSVARRILPDIEVVTQTRAGKGNALACGFAAATGDIIVMIDADGSNDPAEISRFVGALEEGADFAKGSRFMRGGGSQDISTLRRVGNYWLNKIVNVAYGTRYTDLCYGYNAFRRHCLGAMHLNAPDLDGFATGDMLWGDGFEIETLITVRIAKAGLKVTEVASFESLRHSGSSNLNAFSDGLRVLRTIHHERKRGSRNIPSDSPWVQQPANCSIVIEEAS